MNRKSTKSGGREYNPNWSVPPTAAEDICDGPKYRGTGMGNMSGEYPGQVPDDPRYDPYNDASRLGNKKS